MFRSHGLRSGEVPGQEFFDFALTMAVCDGLKCVAEIGKRLDDIEFSGLDQGCDDTPVFAAGVVASEQGVLAIEGQFPFILPMSGNFTGSTIDGTRISAPM